MGPGVHHNSSLSGATNTALPITTSCSFNRSLWHATGNAIAREGRAYANVGMSGLTFWTPVM
jgi:beta-D-xylosidase 4